MSVTKHPDSERATRQVLSGCECIQAEMDDRDLVDLSVNAPPVVGGAWRYVGLDIVSP